MRNEIRALLNRRSLLALLMILAGVIALTILATVVGWFVGWFSTLQSDVGAQGLPIAQVLVVLGGLLFLGLAIYSVMRWRRTQSTDVQRRRQTKGIFISYRRDESAGYAGRIADSFQEHFGEDKVFRDIDSIEPGLDFAEAIERAVGSSEVLIAVIGKNWLTATDAAGRKRLETADDYVRMEIAAALKRNIRVVPLLVQGASMPSADELPDDLAPLTRRNAFELHDTSWRDDVRRLTGVLKRLIER
jgi:hypothetical protein